MTKKIILDTNFLIYCVKYKIQIEKELDRIIDSNYKIYIIDKTLDELKKLRENNKTKLQAKIALEICSNFKAIETNKDKLVDDLIKESIDNNTIVATNDKALKSSLKCQVIVVRSKSHLELTL